MQDYNGFTVTSITEVEEIQAKLVQLTHKKSGAQVMHLQYDDPENLFCLSFRTIPETSNGVAHILEHTVLCGSEKFPVRDPFFNMTRRSLNTYMNALTGADFTCYPAASQVEKDFYNLLDVYIDAVFYPKLDELSFRQEGHRLEHTVGDDPTTPLEFKGIVFNEMKGALSSPNTRFSEAIHAALYPDITYGINSGGDPAVIPNLTYQELLDFHTEHYHPSRCLFFFYGNLPLEPHLDFIAERVLNNTEKAAPLPPLPRQKRFEKPVQKRVSYPFPKDESQDKKTIIGLGWLTCHVLDQDEALAIAVLDSILTETDASPLRSAILKSGLATQMGAYTDMEVSEVPYIISCRGCDPDAGPKLEKLILDTLADICQKGIEKERIERALHLLSLARLEITGDHGPYGLSLFFRSALLTQHGGSPEHGLKIHSLFDRLRARLESEPRTFEDLIQRHFLDNPHRALVVMQPDPELAEAEEAAEKERLAKIVDKLKPEDTAKIVSRAKALEALQETEEDVELLPKVTLSDVKKSARILELNQQTSGSLNTFHHPVFTNGILYTDLVFPLPEIHSEDLFALKLYTKLLTQLGTTKRSYTECLEFMQENTGGVSASLGIEIQCSDPNVFRPTFHLRGKALNQKAGKLFPFMADYLSCIDLSDKIRLKEVFQKHHTALESSLMSQSLRYAIGLSSSAVTPASALSEQWSGLSYMLKIRHIAENMDTEFKALVATLERMRDKLSCPVGADLILSCEQAAATHLQNNDYFGLGEIATTQHSTWKPAISPLCLSHQGRMTAAPVAFTAKVFPSISYTHPDAPALACASAIFDNIVLHKRIREQGGAYGGGSGCNTATGLFYFYAYRDPNIASTLSAFEEALEQVVSGDFEAKDLEEAQLEVVQGLDSPIAPGSRAEVAYGWQMTGKTLSVRRAFRDRLLALNPQAVQDAVQKHLLHRYPEGKVVTFAGQELLEKENPLLKETLDLLPLDAQPSELLKTTHL